MDGRVRLGVEDEGPGIPEPFQARVFERFARAGDLPRHTGSGLGLVIAKTLVEGMRGRIAFRSTPGQGTTFWVDLPCRARQPSA